MKEMVQVQRIATDAERCYIFERDVEDMHQQLSMETQRAKTTKIKHSLGRMLPGESIVDASMRLQKHQQSTPFIPDKSKDNDDEIEWETISLSSRPRN